MMFGVEDYRPEGENIEGKEWIVPAEAYGVKVMSIGFFIPPGDALMWRGPMATNALRQMIHQTLWGPLDFLLLGPSPGNGRRTLVRHFGNEGGWSPDRHDSPTGGFGRCRTGGTYVPQRESEHSDLDWSRTWPGSLPPSCPTIVTIFSEKGEAARIARTRKAAPTGQHTSDSQRVGSGGQRTARHLRKLAGRKILRPFGRKCRRRILRKQSLTITFSLYDDNSLRTRRFFLTSES